MANLIEAARLLRQRREAARMVRKLTHLRQDPDTPRERAILGFKLDWWNQRLIELTATPLLSGRG